MSDTSLVDICVNVFKSLLGYLQIDHKFMTEVPESSLNSGEPVNVLIGITGDLEGNIMLGYTPETAKLIAQKMAGSKEIDEMDIYSKSALVDFSSEFARRAIVLASQKYKLSASNASFAAGDDMYAMISKVPSKKLFFKIEGEKFNIAYNLDQT